MKRLAITVLAGLLLSVATRAQKDSFKAKPDAKTEAELRQLERDRLNAHDNNDVAAMERILAEDFFSAAPNGKIFDKKQAVALLKPGQARDENVWQYTEDTAVRIYGNTAILTGTYYQKQRQGDQEQTLVRARYTDTYVKRKGRWQIAASHVSPLLTR
jgi:hypothetical protein